MGKKLCIIAAAILGIAPVAAAADAAFGGWDDSAECIDPWYAGTGAQILLPGSGLKLDKPYAQSLFAGMQLSDAWAVEVSGLCAPNATMRGVGGSSAVWGAGTRALWYFGGDLIGYERFAPCLSFGAEAYGARRFGFAGGKRAAGGPSAGIMFYWHLDDSWSLRAGARMSFLCGSRVETVACAGIGLAYSWGGRNDDLEND